MWEAEFGGSAARMELLHWLWGLLINAYHVFFQARAGSLKPSARRRRPPLARPQPHPPASAAASERLLPSLPPSPAAARRSWGWGGWGRWTRRAARQRV